MILAATLGLFQALLIDFVLFYIGKILVNPEQLRSFLGLNSQENQSDYAETTFWVRKIGQVVQLIALFSALTSLVTSLTIIFKSF